jgi:hypothetical protein
MKVQRDEDDGKILLGNNTGGKVAMPQLIRFQCDRVWISTGLLCIYAYS